MIEPRSIVRRQRGIRSACLAAIFAPCAIAACDASRRDGASAEIEIVAQGARTQECVRPAGVADNQRFRNYKTFACVIVAVPTRTILRPSLDAATPDPDPGLLTEVVRDSRGRLFTTSKRGEPVHVWDSLGAYVGSVGRRGTGPGEFGEWPLSLFIDDSDTLHVLDSGGRWHVFDSRFKHIRTFSVAPAHRAVTLLPDGSIVVTNAIAGSGSKTAMQVISRDGRSTADVGSLSTGARDKGARLVTSELNQSVWIAPPQGAKQGYALENRNRLGEVLSVVRREVPWFPNDGYSDEPRLPSFRMLHADEEGLLWVAIGVKDPRWRPRKTGESSLERESASTELYDLRIEVIDPKSGNVLASVRHDTIDERVLPPIYPVGQRSRLFWGMTTDSLGQGTLTMYELKLVARDGN